jgi:predicted DNA-binding transcriptional regulator AlpA
MKADTRDETPNRHAKRALAVIGRGRNTVVAPEWVSLQGICQLLSISKSSLWRLMTYHGFPRGQRFGGLDMERVSLALIREWCAKQPGIDEITAARGRRGGARLVAQETQSGVTG